MSFSFNLVDEPFIPCLFPSGESRPLSLKETLLQAPAIREVYDPSPLVTFSLHRLLLAVLHRAFGPEDEDAWVNLWKAGHWDREVIEGYYAQWHDRFDLFDEEHPFYQVPGFGTDEAWSINKLAHELASGNNAVLFDHSRDSDVQPISASEAACLLIAQQDWGLSGTGPMIGAKKVQFSFGNDVKGLSLLIEGQNLFETLMLNLLPKSRRQGFPWSDEDKPAWEQDQPTEADDDTPPRGYLDYLTCQSRLIRLCPEEAPGGNIEVREYHIGQGRKLPEGFSEDPFKLYLKDAKRGFVPRQLSTEQALWRESSALFRLGSETGRRPLPFELVASLALNGVVQRTHRYRVAAFELDATRAKVNSWRHERMPLPVSYLVDANLVGDLSRALDVAEEVGKALHRAACHLAALALAPTEGRKPDRRLVQDWVSQLASGRFYWADLELPFHSFFLRLAERDAEGREDEVIQWALLTGTRARKAFDLACHGLETTPRTLKAVTQARQSLQSQLYSRGEEKGILAPYREALEAVQKGGA